MHLPIFSRCHWKWLVVSTVLVLIMMNTLPVSLADDDDELEWDDEDDEWYNNQKLPVVSHQSIF